MREVKALITNKLQSKLTGEGYGPLLTVPVIPNPCCEVNQCWLNVPKVIEQHGGSLVSGRTLWKQHSGKWYHLEAHAIWQTPEGELVDPSPKYDGLSEITFVQEPLEFKGYLIPGRYIQNVPNSDLTNFIELEIATQEIVATIPCGLRRKLTPSEVAVFNEKTFLALRLFPLDQIIAAATAAW